jgi:transcriptional regulator with XRE-family HTH domain
LSWFIKKYLVKGVVNMPSEFDQLDVDLGQKLRAFRKTLGLTQVQIAEVLCVSFQQVQKLEKGKNHISLKSVYTLCKHFNKGSDIFFSDESLDKSAVKNIYAKRKI